MRTRPIAAIQTTPDFEKAFERLPANIQNLFAKKEDWFRADAHDPRLRTHRLHGRLDGLWAYSVNQQYRVLFQFLSTNEVIYYDIGTHAIYGR